jgi:hypothetical protein
MRARARASQEGGDEPVAAVTLFVCFHVTDNATKQGSEDLMV